MASLRVGMQYVSSKNARFLQDLRNFFSVFSSYFPFNALEMF